MQGGSVAVSSTRTSALQSANEFLNLFSQFLCRCADWIEHVLDTRGEPYLNLPVDELSFIVRNLVDVYALLAACCCISALAARAVLQLLLSRCRPVLKAWLTDGSLPWSRTRPED